MGFPFVSYNLKPSTFKTPDLVRAAFRLHSPSILRRIIETAQISKEDLVIEIGPGLGRLTKMLAERAKNVMAIELDEKLFEELRVQLADYKNIELICGDALKYLYENLPEFKVVANIPYYITTPVILPAP